LNKFVIGGGWSVSQIDTRKLHRYGHTYGVNDAALFTNVFTAVTMDRLWFEHRWPMLKARRIDEVYVREKCDCNVKRDSTAYWKTFKHHHKPGMSKAPGELFGGNSGTCAINLAYQSMADGDSLFLLGFDMCRGPGNEPYWYPAYPWANPDGGTKPGHYRDWVKQFDDIAKVFESRKMKVYSVNPRTQIKNFPIITPTQMLELASG
jgi:hypothetical protein